ncbi:MAG: hypothetical protein RR654_05415 [Oscillospiraceae bacterium]
MWTSIALPMKQDIETIRLAANKICASHAFTSMFLWKEAMQLSIWLEPDGYLVQQGSRGENHYFFPCGTDDAKARMLSMLPPNAVLHYADAQDLAFMEQWRSGKYSAQPARGDWEYLYDRQAQLELPGTRYGKIRRKVNHVRSLPGWKAQPIDAQNLPLVYELESEWHKLSYNRIGAADGQAVATALKYFQELALFGILAFTDNGPTGYFLGAYLDENTFCGIAPRALDSTHFAGLRWELYHSLSPTVHTINLEEDMDLDGLRQNKTELRPIGFYEMWDIQLSDTH